jgi:hypothetical protein
MFDQLTMWRANSYKSWNQWQLGNLFSLIDSKSLLVLYEHSCDAYLVWETWGSDFDYFVKIYSLMLYDAFNGSLVEHCLVYVAGLKLVTCPHIQETRRIKSPNKCALEVTGPTGDRHRSDRCQPSEVAWVGDPAPVPGWPGTPLCAAGWPDPYGRVTRERPNLQEKGWFGVKGNERLDTFQLINHLCVVTKFGMRFTKQGSQKWWEPVRFGQFPVEPVRPGTWTGPVPTPNRAYKFVRTVNRPVSLVNRPVFLIRGNRSVGGFVNPVTKFLIE